MPLGTTITVLKVTAYSDSESFIEYTTSNLMKRAKIMSKPTLSQTAKSVTTLYWSRKKIIMA
jgi:hypothetical protein